MTAHKKVVVIGGGTGQSIILRGLKQIPDINLSTIVTVADDGGSTGRLRRAYQIPAMGDIRNVMLALAESESLLNELMSYRFEDNEEHTEDDLAGHNLGNIILTALTTKSGSFMEAITLISKVLNVKGDIIPSTTQVVTLYAHMEDGTIVKGETNIPKTKNKIKDVFYNEPVEATKQAIKALEQADLIVFGIGSLYTSICANLIIPDIRKALQKTHARKVYLCNAMTQKGETDNYTMEDHVSKLETHSGITIDEVLMYSDKIPQSLKDKYATQDACPVIIKDKFHPYKVIHRKLLTYDNDLIRHDSNRIQNAITAILKELDGYVLYD
ncbi:MAG: hypothetical protein FD133_316 [Erysipelotrichaceae bacterium]|nr:MAG: hypothetical protein FD179_1214 [Erysipelotrichaceae bacterium]TXT19498.1 MAG: hypothetical protein FD133_316 [Erysipelotrichaceae bacterium]